MTNFLEWCLVGHLSLKISLPRYFGLSSSGKVGARKYRSNRPRGFLRFIMQESSSSFIYRRLIWLPQSPTYKDEHFSHSSVISYLILKN